jgi:2-polyprenyl-3-methyl-5-hydroxy-6-metoxy-1,4-benzoquinol methylase
MDREENIMEKNIESVREYYNGAVEEEWSRIHNRPEFLLTCRMLNRYISAGDKVLDIGGGPGRYSLYLAEKGCDVTLFDLSPENVKFASQKASELDLRIKTVCGDARTADTLVNEQFDHVLLMGPMYHLLEEEDRIKAVNAALKLLKPGGILYVSFINSFAGMIYAMKYAPEIIASQVPCEVEYMESVVNEISYGGDAFTKAFFAGQNSILPFMSRFPLEKLHFFGQEGITSPCEGNIMSQPEEIVNLWLDFCEKTWEREDLLSWSEHLMYVGRKI